MSNLLRVFVLAGVLVGLTGTPAVAQKGFALKGHFIYNHSAVDGAQRLPAMTGFGLGAEYVLPFGLSLGLSGYTAGRVQEATETNSIVGLVETNYFLRLPILPVAPYAGVHAALGSSTWDDLSLEGRPRIRDTGAGVGYQFGVRFQPISMIGIDAQYRRMSDWAGVAQSENFERSQVLLGITLF